MWHFSPNKHSVAWVRDKNKLKWEVREPSVISSLSLLLWTRVWPSLAASRVITILVKFPQTHTHTHTHQLEPRHSKLLQSQYIFGHVILFITFLYYSDQHALNQQLYWDPEWGHSLWGVSNKPRGWWWWCVEECSTHWTQPWSYSNPLLTSEASDPRYSNSTPSNLQPSKMVSFLQTVSGWLHPVRLSYTALWSIMAEIYSRVSCSWVSLDSRVWCSVCRRKVNM